MTTREESGQNNHAPTPAPEPASNLGATLLRVAWLAILLGLAMEVLLLALGGALGDVLGLKPLVADLVRNVTWSVFVCAMHQGALEVLQATDIASGGSSALLIALIKGLEYGCLGLVIGWVGTRPWGGAAVHAAVGLAIGLVFGGTILGLANASAPEPLATAELVSRGVNEILFPVGCSLVLFSATVLAKKATSQD